MKPIRGDTPQEVEYLKRSAKLWLVLEQGAVTPYREDLVYNTGSGIEIGYHRFFSNSPGEERVRHCLQLQYLLGFSGKEVKTFHYQ